MARERIKRALLIDDDGIDQRQLKRVIDRSGLIEDLVIHSYAEQALDFLSEPGDSIDLILLDINMPRMNGFEFLDKLPDVAGKMSDDCVVIMLTTSLNRADKDRALAYDPVKAFVNKPLTIEDIVIAARHVEAQGSARA